MKTVFVKDDFIKLGQALKLAGVVGLGSEVKILLEDGLVKVNGELAFQRGKKVYVDDIISVTDLEDIVVKKR